MTLSGSFLAVSGSVTGRDHRRAERDGQDGHAVVVTERAGAAGKDAEDITASDVTLVTLLVDASSSIHDRGLEDAVRDGQNSLVDALTANVAYAERLRSSGTPCKSVVVVVTDGEDCGSKRRAADCARTSKIVLASEQFTLAFVGVGAGDFHTIAREMGVPDGCIAVQAQATPSAIRQVFRMVSQSAIRASQGRIAPGPNAGLFSP